MPPLTSGLIGVNAVILISTSFLGVRDLFCGFVSFAIISALVNSLDLSTATFLLSPIFTPGVRVISLPSPDNRRKELLVLFEELTSFVDVIKLHLVPSRILESKTGLRSYLRYLLRREIF
uniref:Uncharacterized protein n=1 Tax=Glossina brevipalpis TaxID=37001 RepID=A0A1A9W6Y4_9MUSC